MSTPDSEKRRFLASSPAARLVVYDGTDDVFRSAISVGTLERIEPSELTVEDVEQYGSAKRPLFEIWQQQKRDLDIELYRLTPASLSGRLVEVDREDHS